MYTYIASISSLSHHTQAHVTSKEPARAIRIDGARHVRTVIDGSVQCGAYVRVTAAASFSASRLRHKRVCRCAHRLERGDERGQQREGRRDGRVLSIDNNSDDEGEERRVHNVRALEAGRRGQQRAPAAAELVH